MGTSPPTAWKKGISNTCQLWHRPAAAQHARIAPKTILPRPVDDEGHGESRRPTGHKNMPLRFGVSYRHRLCSGRLATDANIPLSRASGAAAVATGADARLATLMLLKLRLDTWRPRPSLHSLGPLILRANQTDLGLCLKKGKLPAT